MSTPAPTVWPCITSADARGLIEFLVGIGFDARFVTPDDGPVVEHAQLSWPEGGGVMLSTVGRTDNEYCARPVGSGSFYVVTDDPRAVLARAEQRGARVLDPGTETDYGSLNVGFADAEGNLWSFGTYRGEP